MFGANLRTPQAVVDGNEAPSLAPPPEMKREWVNENKADISSDVISDSEILEPRETPVKATKSAAMIMNRSARGSLDSEGLFPLEGMDKNVEVDPDEEHDDVAPVTGRSALDPDAEPVGPRPIGNIARSLPVTVPGFGRSERDRCHAKGDADEDDADRVVRLPLFNR